MSMVTRGDPSSNNFKTRFAPSPTGFLHLGHAFSALTAFDMAKAAGGKFLLRMEDIDTVRCKPEFEDAIYEDLAWLGIDWETPVRRQSERLEVYHDGLETLKARNIAYRCFKTRKEITDDIARAPHLSAHGPDGPIYIGEMLSAMEERSQLAAGRNFAWRLSMQKAKSLLGKTFDTLIFEEFGKGPNGETGSIKATPQIFGDVVIGRKDNGTSYHLACVLDDADQGITHVVRGNDLFPASHLHRLLQNLLALPTPVYCHHHLITDESGKRFSKRDQSVTLRALRADGVTPDDIRKRLVLAPSSSV